MISSIYAHGNADPPTPDEADRRRREASAQAWHRHKIIMLRLDDVLDDWIRQAFENEANRLYGKRGSNHG